MPKPSLDILQKNLDYLAENGRIEKTNAGDLEVDRLMDIASALFFSIESLLGVNLQQRDKLNGSSLKMLIMDCDGVLTDSGMYFTESGDEIKRFNAKDGLGIKKLHEKGIKTGIISAGINKKIVEHRARMLGIERVYIGQEAKLNILESWLKELNLSPSQVAYIGDDLTDLPVLRKVGFSICPADAATDVRRMADLVLSRNGGDGCIRELVDNYLLG